MQTDSSSPIQLEDFSKNFQDIRRKLNDETAGAYQAFIKQLAPDYRKVWLDILLGYAMMFAGVALACQWHESGVALRILISLLAAAWIGYWMAYLSLFIHEAAHLNLHPEQKINDTLCNVFLSVWNAIWIKQYRKVHFLHHSNLGTVDDTENSYFNALTPKFMFEMLTGLHALRIVLQRRRALQNPEKMKGPPTSLLPLLASLSLHAIIIGVLVLTGHLDVAASWVIGMGVFFPFFGALRQLLEHRNPQTPAGKNCRLEPHGAYTRMFRRGPFASTFGGAGFDRHLLHHWEPQISYTRFEDLENYLQKTSAKSILDARRFDYVSVFIQLLNSNHHAA